VSAETLHLVGRAHMVLGWLAVAALTLPAVLLFRSRRRFAAIAIGSTIVATLASILGGILYAWYTPLLKRAVYVASVRHGLAMERKEHLAVLAIALAWAGALVHLVERRDEEVTLARARFAHGAYVAAAALALTVALLGNAVASIRAF
jgi:formate hydrogenlyase subunit 3/multisubunit Na+/H+ antiporter MnhD subunit